MSESTTRPCARCSGDRHWTGTRWRCARCTWEYQQKRRANLSSERREAERARSNDLRMAARAEWSPEQREERNAYTRAWREANREQHRRVTHEWYQANIEHARAAKLAEYRADPEQFYARNLVRKARILDAVCVHGPKCVDRDVLKSVYASECIYCGAAAEAADHFYPLARGGLNCRENIVPSCQSCNSRKSARDPAEWLASLAS